MEGAPGFQEAPLQPGDQGDDRWEHPELLQQQPPDFKGLIFVTQILSDFCQQVCRGHFFLYIFF